MGVLDGQPVNQAITNPAFINKNINDVMPNQLGFARPLSGPTIADIQRAVNNLYTATGVSETQNGTDYNAASGTILNGDSHLVALTKLANKFHSATGHHHTGFAGDGPLLDVVRSLNISGGVPTTGDLTLVAGSNMMILQSVTGYTFNAVGSSTTVAASGNPDLTGQILLVAGSGVSLSQTGQNIFISASGGGGTGTGNKNYLTTYLGNPGNGDFELGSTVGFSLFNTTLTGVIPTGAISAGATSIDIFSAEAGAPLAGRYSLDIGSSTTLTAGQGFISDSFVIDEEDQAKPMAFKGYYKVQANPSNGNFSGASTNTLAAYIYDVTNSAWIQPAGVYNFVQSSGVGIVSGTFQSTSNSTHYRLAILCINSSSGAIEFYFDDLFLGPQTAPAGAAISDEMSYTPTFSPDFGSVTNVNFYSSRRGDKLYVRGCFTTGTTNNGTNATISLGYNGINSNVITSPNLPSEQKVGEWTFDSPSTAEFSHSMIAVPSVNYLMPTGLNGTDGGLLPRTADSIFGANAIVTFFAEVPILGWSSNTVMSNDTDTRIVSMSAGKSAGGNSASGVETVLGFDIPVNDTHGAFDGTLFHVPVSGDYRVTGSIQFGGNTSGFRNLNVQVNGSILYLLGKDSGPGSSDSTAMGSLLLTGLVAGETIGLSQFQNSGSTLALAADGLYSNYMMVERISGPATIAATESVSFHVQGNFAGAANALPTFTSIPLFSTLDTTRSYDTHGGYDPATGIYTVPVSGKYRFTGGVGILGNYLANYQMTPSFILNGNYYVENPVYITAATFSGTIFGQITAQIPCIAGDQVYLTAGSNGGGNWDNNSNADFFEGERIGN